jgi:DNA polymerase III delta prime subunit
VQLALESLEPNDLIPRLKTIVKKEKLTFMTDAVLLKIAQNSNAQPRAAINLLQATASAYYGSKDLKVALNSAISALGANVDLLAAKLLACVYTHKQKAIINTLKLVKTGEYISIASYLLYTNSYLIESKVGINTWTNEARNKLNAAIADNKPSLQKMLMVHSELVEIKKALATFLVPEADVLMCNLLKLSIGD